MTKHPAFHRFPHHHYSYPSILNAPPNPSTRQHRIMSYPPTERITSNLYDDLGPPPHHTIRRIATAPTKPSPIPAGPPKRILIQPQSPTRSISDVAPRKAPSPPVDPERLNSPLKRTVTRAQSPTESNIHDNVPAGIIRRGASPPAVTGIGSPGVLSPSPPLVNVTLSASLSQKRRTAARVGKREQMETFQFVQLPNSNTVNDSTAAGTAVSKEEVEQLRRKVTLLESKLEELQDTVRMLQRHTDPQRQAALEDWAIEKMISVYNQFFPQPKSTIPELVRLFNASGQKSVLTSAELEYLGSLARVRNIKVQEFMLTPPWFDQEKEDDLKEIARYVVKAKDSDVKKRNLRLYKFATGRAPKVDARPR